MKDYYVYILTNVHNNVLYVGMTNDLNRRVHEHNQKLIGGFTTKYNLNKLVYFEHTEDVGVAIAREKQLKGGSRAKKVALIESMNSDWDDLAQEIASS